jgi:hypothetical protein
MIVEKKSTRATRRLTISREGSSRVEVNNDKEVIAKFKDAARKSAAGMTAKRCEAEVKLECKAQQ